MSGVDWLSRDLFKCPVYYALCLDERAFKAEMKRLKITNSDEWIKNAHSDATTHFMVGPEGKLSAIVCLRVNAGRDPVEIVGLLVHEAVHIWQEVKTNIGEQHPSPEFEAYSIQWIAQQLVAACAKRLKRRAPLAYSKT